MDLHGRTVADVAGSLADIPFFASLKPDKLLREVPLLGGFDAERLNKIADRARLIEVAEGEIVSHQGEYDRHLYIILKGMAEVSARTEGRPKVVLARYGPGTFFGRTSIHSDSPNATTVRALEHMVLLALHGDDLVLLADPSGEVARVLTHTHQRRLLRYGLRLVPFFAEFGERDLEELGRSGELRQYERGEVIFRQGERGDSLHLVLRGIVKVAVDGEEGETILAYLKRGACFGEMALLKNETRMASVIAVNPTETLQIMKDTFEAFLSTHPDIADAIQSTIAEREAENAELEKHPERAAKLKFMEGLVDSSEVLAIDLNRCIRCRSCVEACEAVRGSARLRVEGERFGSYLVATACRQCRDPACMLCPRGAITRDKHGEIHIGEDCVGCGFCAKQCPYGNITIVAVSPDPETGKKRRRAVKCDLCRDRDYPPCVYNCPTGALRRISPELFMARAMSSK